MRIAELQSKVGKRVRIAVPARERKRPKQRTTYAKLLRVFVRGRLPMVEVDVKGARIELRARDVLS